MKIHILDKAARSAFLPVPADWYPLYINRHMLRSQNINVQIHTKPEGSFFECDVAFVSSRYFNLHTLNHQQHSAALNEIRLIKSRIGKLMWFDMRDSTGNTQFEVLPIVDRYLKKQLLRDKRLYQNQYYGNRIYTDYIHNSFGITDAYKEPCQPLDPQYIDRIGISWNPGLLDFRGGIKSRLLYHRTTDLMHAYFGSGHTFRWTTPNKPRNIDMLATFNTNYGRNTVAWQRHSVNTLLKNIDTKYRIIYNKRLPLAKEIAYRQNAKIVLSLFGWGELCSRDYQSFIAGAALIAPDTTHLETWPTTHIAKETYWPIRWDMTNLPEAFQTLIQNADLRHKIADNAQRRYQYLWSQTGRQQFCQHIANLISQHSVTPASTQRSS